MGMETFKSIKASYIQKYLNGNFCNIQKDVVLKKETEEQRTIIAIAGSVRKDYTLFTEEALRKMAETHKKFSLEDTDQGLTLIWTGPIPNNGRMP